MLEHRLSCQLGWWRTERWRQLDVRVDVLDEEEAGALDGVLLGELSEHPAERLPLLGIGDVRGHKDEVLDLALDDEPVPRLGRIHLMTSKVGHLGLSNKA